MAKRGRPVKEDAKRDGYRLRLNEEERDMLDILKIKTGRSISEILRKGIELQYYLEDLDVQKVDELLKN